METSTANPATTPAPSEREPFLRWAENLLPALCLAAMVMVPLTEAVLRRTFNTGIAASASIVQHLCLLLGMAGGAIAARDGRLLTLSTVSSLLKGKPAQIAHALAFTFGALICVALTVASWQFMLQEKAAGLDIAYGVKRWVFQACMPVGFGLIALRLSWKAGDTWPWRLGSALATLALGALAAWAPIDPSRWVWPAMGLLAAATILGTPVFIVLGGAAAILFWGQAQPLAVLPIEHYSMVMNATLPTIPLFTLAGCFLAEGGASKRLVRVCQAWVGHFRGGAAIATAMACAFFTCFTGASGVTILALGSLLMPVLLTARYTERQALGLLTGAGSLGLLFPPCLPLILYAVVAKIQIKEIFLAGLVPGTIMVLLTWLLGYWQSRTLPTETTFCWKEARESLWASKWELLLPVVALVAMFGGFATTMEAAALTAFYAFVVEAIIHRDLCWRTQVLKVLTECTVLVGGVLLILGVALGLTSYLVEASVADQLLAWIQNSIHSKWLFLLVLNLFLLIVGCLMDVFSAVIVVAPLVVPLGLAFGVDPVHLGIIFLANLELGYLTPPVGMNLFLASYRFKKSMWEVARAVIPTLMIRFVGVLLITYVAPLTTMLPRWFSPPP